MVLEATMIVYVTHTSSLGTRLTTCRVDNSESSRNGDYVYAHLTKT